MKHLLVVLLIALTSCESHSFESDKRQIVAKNEIRKQLRKARFLDITGFKQDTLTNHADSNFKRPIRYGLEFVYTDSNNIVQKKKGVVLFTPDGKSVLSSQITDRD